LHLIGRVYWAATASDFWIGKVMLMHSMMDAKVLLAFLMVEVCGLITLDRCMTMLNAIGNNLTLNEYRNAHDYKYLF